MFEQPKYFKSKLSQKDFDQLSHFILERYGINISPNKKVLLEYRLQKRLQELGLNTYEEYTSYLFSKEGINQEPKRLINEVSTNKTEFFREKQHFKILQEEILPRLSMAKKSDITPIWSAACSSGEEAYTLAIVLEEFRRLNPQFNYKILATDVSDKVINIGKKAIYSQQETQSIDPSLLRKYFLRSKNPDQQQVRVVKLLRDKVQFQYLNLMNRQYQTHVQFSIIFCRNTLIYFDFDTKKEIVLKLCERLKPGGFLFISHTESLVNMNHGLKMIYPSVYRKLNRDGS